MRFLLGLTLGLTIQFPRDAILMIPAKVSPSGEAISFEGRCEESRIYAPALECRAEAPAGAEVKDEE